MTMNSFKKVAVVAALALGASVSANAASYSFGALDLGDYLQSHQTSGTSFSDTYSFSVGALDTLTIGSFSLVSGSKGTQILGMSLTSGLTTLATATGVTAGTMSSVSFASPITLTAGSYGLSVTGKGTGTYYTTIGVASAVPEPETYAMMLAGLGMMGFIARRRKQNKG